MPKYLVVTKENSEVNARLYKQLLDGVVAANKLFEGSRALAVENGTPDVAAEQASMVLELHDGDKDAFVFRIPSCLSGQLVFGIEDGLQYLKAEKDKTKLAELEVKTTEKYAFVSF